MAFTVRDFTDLVRLLNEHPEWQSELRRIVLTDELLTLPDLVRELAEAQKRTELRVEELAEAQKRTEQRLDRLEAVVVELAEAQKRTEQRVEELAEAIKKTQITLAELTYEIQILTGVQKEMKDRLGALTGTVLEIKYREHVGGYFGRWLKQARAVKPESLEDILEESLSHDDLLEVLRLDLLVSGRLRGGPDSPEIWLAVEVAYVLDEEDVLRAVQRATLLRKAGYRALPLIAGEVIKLEAEAVAREKKVAVVQDGRGFLWDETLAAWETNQAEK